MTPLPLRSTHWNASLRPMCTTEPLLPSNSARLVTQTLPSRSTVVRDGSAPRPAGAVRYSPRILPVTASIFTAVLRPDLATQTKGKGSVTWLTRSSSWCGALWLVFRNSPASKSASRV